MERALRLVLPKKGRLCEDAARIFSRSGFVMEKASERTDFAKAIDRNGEIAPFEVLSQRPADALDNLADGLADIAFVGLDTYIERQTRARELRAPFAQDIAAHFNAAACALWIAAPSGQGISTPADLAGKTIVTAYPATLRAWLDDNNVAGATVIARDGGIEDYVRLGLADAVCDIVQSGRTLAENGLEPKIKLYDSCAILVTRAQSREPAARIVQRFVEARP